MEQNQLREKIERQIERTAEEIFSLKKDGKFDSEECNALKTKIIGDLWKWAKSVFGNRIENAGVEIMKCVSLSLEKFDETKQEKFMNYISAALKSEIKRANEKQRVFEASAIDFPKKKERRLRQILRLVENYGKDISDSRTLEKISAMFGTTAKEIEALLSLRERALTTPETAENDDGEVVSRFDTANFLSWKQSTLSKSDFEIREELSTKLSKIDQTFKNAQKRTKPYLAALLTHRVLTELEKAQTETETINELLCGVSFTNSAESKRVIRSFFGSCDFVSQEQVAAWFGRDKTDASRTMRNFRKMLEEKLSTQE